MKSYMNFTVAEKADYLVHNKGEMSVELWNDRAQCVLASLLHDNTRLRDRVAKLRLIVDAVKSLATEERMREEMLCYNQGVILLEWLGALDAGKEKE